MCPELHQARHTLPTEGSTRIQKLALANYQIPLSKCQAIPSKKQTMRPPFWESFLNPKMGDRYTPHLLFAITTAPTPCLGIAFRLPKLQQPKAKQQSTRNKSTNKEKAFFLLQRLDSFCWVVIQVFTCFANLCKEADAVVRGFCARGHKQRKAGSGVH